MTYIYIRSEPQLWTVGYSDPNDKFGWVPESDHDTPEAAADRTAYLNGSHVATKLERAVPDLLRALQNCLNVLNDDPDTAVFFPMDDIKNAIKKAT